MHTTPLVVAGAHLLGQPLNPVLVTLGARFLRATRTAPVYRMVALPALPALPARPGREARPALPPRPGLIRCPDGVDGDGVEPGYEVDVEVYELPVSALGLLLLTAAAPLAIGTVSLTDGSTAPGFVCEGYAAASSPDISRHGGWRSYLTSLTPGVSV